MNTNGGSNDFNAENLIKPIYMFNQNEINDENEIKKIVDQVPHEILNKTLVDISQCSNINYLQHVAQSQEQLYLTPTNESLSSTQRNHMPYNNTNSITKPNFNEIISPEECQVYESDVKLMTVKWRTKYLILAAQFYAQNKLIEWKAAKIEEMRNRIAKEKGDTITVKIFWENLNRFQEYQKNLKFDMYIAFKKFDLERIEENRIRRLLNLYKKRCWTYLWNSKVPDYLVNQYMTTNN